ncbi:MAG: tRNA epoxyqueuosine(34) reductase QueG [Nitrospiria bacterium]
MNHPQQSSTDRQTLTEKIKIHALALGFDQVGIASAEPVLAAGRHFLNWLTDGFEGEMAYLRKKPENRFDPKRRFPEAKTVISLAFNYYQPLPEKENDDSNGASFGKVARYAWGEDYHQIIEKKLAVLIAFITKQGGTCWKGYVDHGALLEKAYAVRAGLGFIGKNTLLITPEFGSWIFLAEVISTLDLVEDVPDPPRATSTSQCGACTRCIDACPTGAITAPFRLDARRCISYQTIENKGPFSEEVIPNLKGWIFGCDICQEVCPFNRQARPTNEQRLSPETGAGPKLRLEDIENIPDNAAFKETYKRSPLLRPKRKGLQRNAATLRLASLE